MVSRDQNTNSNEWVYEPSLVDLRFLKAADYIIRENKADNIKPDTDSSISKMIYGHSSIIREIRNFQRGVAITELHKFASYFHLDFNYFFRGTQPMVYDSQITGRNRDIDIKGNNVKNIDIISETTGNIHKGDVYIIKTKKIILL